MRKAVLVGSIAIAALFIAPCGYIAYRVLNAPIGSDPATTCWLATGLGDVDSDGFDDLAVTMRFDPATGADSFTTWVLSQRLSTPLYTIRVDPSLVDRRQNPEFGTYTPAWHKVHRLVDLDRDGCADIGVSCILSGSAESRSKSVVLSGKHGRVLLDDLPSGRWAAGPNFETLGDANDDGTPDLLITLSGDSLRGVAPHVRVVSGTDGSEIGDITAASYARRVQLKGFPDAIAPMLFGQGLCVISDVDGDAVPDFVVSDPGFRHDETIYPSVFCYSTRTGTLLWSLDSEFDLKSKRIQSLGWQLDSIGDVNRDGFDDVCASVYPRGQHFVSGRDGTPLVALESRPEKISPLGDIDGDAFFDFAVHRTSRGETRRALEIVSGKPDSVLFECAADPRAEFIRACGPAGDVNRDGTPDIAITGDVAMVADGRKWKPAYGVVTVHSGRDGSVLRTYDADTFRKLSEHAVPSVVIH